MLFDNVKEQWLKYSASVEAVLRMKPDKRHVVLLLSTLGRHDYVVSILLRRSRRQISGRTCLEARKHALYKGPRRINRGLPAVLRRLLLLSGLSQDYQIAEIVQLRAACVRSFRKVSRSMFVTGAEGWQRVGDEKHILSVPSEGHVPLMTVK